MRSQYYGGLADASCGMGCEYRWENFGPTDDNVYDGQECDDFEVVDADCNIHASKWDKDLGTQVPIGTYTVTHFSYWNEELCNGTGDWVRVELTAENVEKYHEGASRSEEYLTMLLDINKKIKV
tara:strand:- start:240 stop:611 length:372 start_codon:yes stop_codon:yes gene_type:complete